MYDAVHAGVSITASRWHQNWWRWWAQSLERLGLEDVELHLRKAPPTKHTPEEERLSSSRFLPDASASTFALVHLLARWSNPSRSGAKKKQDELDAWKSFFAGFLARFTNSAVVEWSLFLDVNVIVRPGLPLSGYNKVRIPMRFGVVDVRPLFDCDETPVQAAICALRFRDASQVLLLDFLLAVEAV
eukprot:2907571-Pyramimonas_sp.AAC.1